MMAIKMKGGKDWNHENIFHHEKHEKEQIHFLHEEHEGNT